LSNLGWVYINTTQADDELKQLWKEIEK
jgi:hypothetical protein